MTTLPEIESHEVWNARIEAMKEDIEFEPLLDFIDRLKEPVEDDDHDHHPRADGGEVGFTA